MPYFTSSEPHLVSTYTQTHYIEKELIFKLKFPKINQKKFFSHLSRKGDKFNKFLKKSLSFFRNSIWNLGFTFSFFYYMLKFITVVIISKKKMHLMQGVLGRLSRKADF